VRFKSFGFTIAEVLVVTGLFMIMFVFGIGILISNNRFYNTQSASIRAVNSIRDAGDKLSEFARSASAFVDSYVYNSTLYEAGSALVILNVPAVDASGDIISSASDYMILGRDPSVSDRLILIVAPHASSSRKERVLEFSDKLSGISFVYDSFPASSAKNVVYDITVTEDLAHDATGHITGSATIRN